MRARDSALEEVLSTSDAINGESGVILRPLGENSLHDTRYRFIWMPGHSRGDVIVAARGIPASVARCQGIFRSRNGMLAIRFRQTDHDAAHTHLHPGKKIRPYVEVERYWKLVGLPRGNTLQYIKTLKANALNSFNNYFK